MEKPYPLWRIIQEEIPRADKTKFTSYTIEVKIDDRANWLELYSTVSKLHAEIAQKRLSDIFDVSIYKWLEASYNIPVMFEICDQIYRTTNVLIGQSCICGETIEGNHRYGEFFIGSNKFSYIDNIIFFYEKGHCLVKCNQVFLDGNLLYTSKQLADLCKEIEQEFNKLDLYPEKLIKFLKKEHPEMISYTCNGYSRWNIKEGE